MCGHKLAVVALLVAPMSLAAPSMGEPSGVSAPSPVVIDDARRVFLSRVARRTVYDAVARGKPYEPDYIADGLASQSAEAVVRLRQTGYLMGVGAGGPGPIVRSARDAALAACEALPSAGALAIEDVAGLLIEIEVIGPPTALPSAVDWTRPAALDPHLEAGIDGLMVRVGDRARRVCPSEIITSDLSVADALKLLAQGLHLTSAQVPQTPLMRFRTAHWYEAAAGERVVSLHRGLTTVSSDAVSPEGLNDVIDRIARYMIYRQRESGLFAYQFEPGADRYSEEDSAVRQAGSALAMAVHARWSGRAASRASADAAIGHHLQGLSDLPSVERAGFIATQDGKNKLGVTALLALALAGHPEAARFEDVRTRLVNGMLALQRPSGMFMTAFPPAVEVRGQDYFPGEALLALANEYDRQPSSDVLKAFDRAIDFYRDYFDASRSPAFVPWQVQAFALMAKHTKRRDYIDYVFALTDYLAARQLTVANCPWPELRGGIAGYGDGKAGVATASYLEAFTDALVLARRVNDAERARRYDELVRGAARFVIQLQVRPEEAYFIRSPQDAVGGIRTGPALNKLRIDHCQHALIALTKAREALFPSDG